MAAASGTIVCALQPQKPAISTRGSAIPKLKIGDSSSDSPRIVLQPRVCTFRAYASGFEGDIKTRRDAEVSPFLASPSDSIENSRKSGLRDHLRSPWHGAVTNEVSTGKSLSSKMDLPAIEEAGGACFAAVLCAAAFAWFSSARTRVGHIFTAGCNSVVDSIVDNLVDGLFYEGELSDWSDEI